MKSIAFDMKDFMFRMETHNGSGVKSVQRFWHKNMRLKSNTYKRAHRGNKKRAPHNGAAPDRMFTRHLMTITGDAAESSPAC